MPIKIITLLLDQYAELQEAKREGGTGKACDGPPGDEFEGGEYDDDDDEYDDDGYDDEFEDEDGFDDDECFGADFGGIGGAPDEKDAWDDPLSRIDLLQELGGFLKNLTTSDVGVSMIKSFVNEFSRRQLEVIRLCSA